MTMAYDIFFFHFMKNGQIMQIKVDEQAESGTVSKSL